MNASDPPPPGPIKQRDVDAFWGRFTAANNSYEGSSYAEAFQFGDDAALADKLLGLVIRGPKRATADTVAGLEAGGGKLPERGDLWVACRGGGSPSVVIESTDVRVGPLSSVDEQFAWDEGEGDRTRADWLRIHTGAFARSYERLGLEMHADIAVIFERFRVLYVEDAALQA